MTTVEKLIALQGRRVHVVNRGITGFGILKSVGSVWIVESQEELDEAASVFSCIFTTDQVLAINGMRIFVEV